MNVVSRRVGLCTQAPQGLAVESIPNLPHRGKHDLVHGWIMGQEDGEHNQRRSQYVCVHVWHAKKTPSRCKHALMHISDASWTHWS